MPFKSTLNECEMLRTRADILRPELGHWDAEDPVSHCILDVIEAQRELNDLFEDVLDNKAVFEAAFAKRAAAAERLHRLTVDRDSWPYRFAR